MNSLWPKIKKLLQALNLQNKIYMVNREQGYSATKGKVYNMLVLYRLTPIEEYNAVHKDKPKNPDKYDFVKEKVSSSFSEVDILKELVMVYKGGAGNGA